MIANQGARRKRSCIEAIIPIDIREAAAEQCRKTIREGGGVPVQDRAKNLMVAFKEHFGVTLEMIEARLEHKLDTITSDEFVELVGVYNSIKDKIADKSEFFPEKTTLADLNKEADAKKEAEEKIKASDFLMKKVADLSGRFTSEQILDKLSIANFSDLKDSKAIYAALEVLHDV